MRTVGEWTLKRQRRRHNAGKLGDKIYQWLFESGQCDSYEVTGELFPRGSLRCNKNIEKLAFLLEFSRRALSKRTCTLAIKGMVAHNQMQPVRSVRETLDQYCERQALKLLDIARRVLSASRSKRYREKRRRLAMDTADTMPWEAEEASPCGQFTCLCCRCRIVKLFL